MSKAKQDLGDWGDLLVISSEENEVIEEQESEQEVVEQEPEPCQDHPSINIGARADDNYLYPATDLGNAEMLAHRYPDSIRYCIDSTCWLYFRDGIWVIDERQNSTIKYFMGKAIRRNSRMINQRQDINLDTKKALMKWATKGETNGRLAAALALAQMLDTFKMKITEFDTHDYLFNFQNGTFDLRTGELRPFSREDYLTSKSPIAYDKDATCPEWEKAILVYMNGDIEAVEYLQESLGMCLTGDREERIFFIWVGGGKNGKSVIIDTVLAIMGKDYCFDAPAGFAQKDKSGKQDHLATSNLQGKRLVIISETGKGVELDLPFVKKMSGDKDITGRKHYQDFVTFQLTHKCILITQHEPIIKETSDGIWDRVHKLTWDYRVPEKEKDIHFRKNIIMPEAAGIMNWLIEGCLRWQKKGKITKPKKVVSATGMYRDDSIPFEEFMFDCCELEYSEKEQRAIHRTKSDKEYRVERQLLYNAYVAHAIKAAYPRNPFALGKKKFNVEIRDLGFEEYSKKNSEGRTVRYFLGIRLKPDAELNQDSVDTDSWDLT